MATNRSHSGCVMWVYECFEGDDLEMALVQHDLYFVRGTPPHTLHIDGLSTLGYIKIRCMYGLAGFSYADPRCRELQGRLAAIGGFDHHNLQAHHEHIAAYYRWAVWRHARNQPGEPGSPERRQALFVAWRDYLRQEIPALMRNKAIAVAVANVLVYRYFEFSDRYYDQLGRLLVDRYGFECLAKTSRGQRQQA